MPRVEETVSDRVISALAIVKGQFDRKTSYLSCFEPFLEHCMFRSEHEFVSIPDLQEGIENRFGLRLPQAVIKTLLRRQESQGHVVVENEVCRIEHDALEGADLESDQREALRKQAALLDALLRYAHEECNKDWSRERAQQLLLEYVEQFSTRLLDAAVVGIDLPEIDEEWEEDKVVVHTFVLHADSSDPRSFEFLEVLVKGQMLADAVYLGEQESMEKIEPLTKLEVFLDTPILLRLLGYAGEELAAPYLELLEMLKRQKAITRCFDVNIEEAERILAAAERAARGEVPERAYGDVVAHLATRAKPSDIALMSQRLSNDLLRLGIQTITLPALTPRHELHRSALSKKLRRRIPEYSEQALATDVKAVVTVDQLRRGAMARSLPKCKAIFVTRNYELYTISSEFFQHRTPGPMIPTCIPMSAFTTMVWVREPLSAPELPRERIIGDAYAALSPSHEGLWRAVAREASGLRQTEDLTARDAHELRVHGESRFALEDEDAAREPYTEGDPEQVNERAKENARREERWRKLRVEKLAERTGRIAARVLFAFVFPLLAVGIVFGPLGVSSDSPLPSLVQWVGTAAFALLGAWSLFDGLSLRHAARRTASTCERWTVRLAFWILGYSRRR